MTGIPENIGLVKKFIATRLPGLVNKWDLTREDKEDLEQELYLHYTQAVISFDRYKPQCQLSTYVFGALKNTVSSYRSGLSRRMANINISDNNLPDKYICHPHMQIGIRHKNITKKQKAILRFRYEHNLPYKQIAKVFNVSERAVKKQTRKALSILREDNQDIHIRGGRSF